MKKELLNLLILFSLTLTSAGAWGAAALIPGSTTVYWEVTGTGTSKTLKLTGSGVMPSFNASSAPWQSEKANISSVSIATGITSIGNYAFQNCTKLSNVTIPNSITSIGTYAFNGCTGLTKVTFNSTSKVASLGNYAFKDCAKLESITIPSSVASIGSNAFQNSGLTSVQISKSVTTFGTDVFRGCASLKSAIFDAESTLTAFSLSDWMFDGCSSLEEVVLPPLMTSIPNYCFRNNTSLVNLIIPSEVASVSASAFYGCNNLKNLIMMPASAPTVSSAFTGITPSNVTLCAADPSVYASGNWSGFNRSQEITGSCGTGKANWTLNLATGVLTLSGGDHTIPALSSSLVACPWEAYKAYVTSIVVADDITSIGKYAFQNQTNVTSITIGKNVTSIGDYAFQNLRKVSTFNYNATHCADFSGQGCQVFKNIGDDATSLVLNIGSNVEYIPAYFLNEWASGTPPTTYAVKNLTTITIPVSVVGIGTSAFGTASKITETYYEGTLAQWCAIAFAGMSSNPTYNSKKLYINNKLVTELVIPDDVTSVGSYAFYNNQALTSIKIPAAVQNIGANAFSSCSNVTTITSQSLTPITAQSNSFSTLSKLEHIYVYSDVAGYKSATGWSSHAAKISLLGGECGDRVTWELDFGTGVIKIAVTSGSAGKMADYVEGGAPWFEYKNYIQKAAFSTSITHIGNHAFDKCTSLTTLYFPFYVATGQFNSTLATIGTYAFRGCSSLKYVVEAKDDYGVSAGSSFKLPAKLTSIGQSAFEGCDITDALTLQNAVTTVGSFAFRNNTNVTSVTLSSALTSVGTSAFDGDTNIEEVKFSGTLAKWLGVTFNSDKANPVYYAKTLKIGSAVLTDCVVPEDVTEVKNYAFVNDEALETINLHDGVTRVGTKAFSGCSNIKHIVAKGATPCGAVSDVFAGVPASIPVYVQSSAIAGVYAAAHSTTATAGWREDFRYLEAYPEGACGESLSWVYDVMGQTLTISGSGAMYDWPDALDRQWREYAADVKTIVWADGCAPTSIGENAFKDFTNLTCGISIPETVTKIGANAYVRCKNTSALLKIPASVQEIGDSAFINHSEIVNLHIGDNEHDSNLQKVGKGAFSLSNSRLLENVYYYGSLANWANIDFANFYATPMCNLASNHDVSFYHNGAKLTSITIEPGATAIKPQVFYNMKDVTGAVTIPSTVTSIGERAFNGTAITSVTIGDEENGSKLTSIGSFAFGSVKTLTNVTVYAMTAPANASSSNFDSKVFNEATLRVHAMAKKSYANEVAWKQFKNVVTFGKMELALSDNADNSAVLAEYDSETVDVQLTRTLVEGVYNTICLPFSLTEEQVEDAFGEGTDIEKLTDSSVSGEEFTVGFAKSDVLAAGVPYLIKPTKAVVNPSFTDVEIDNTDNTSSTAHVDFIGITSKTHLEASRNLLFVGANNTLYYPDASGDMKGMRAYFILKSSVPAGARGRIVMHENTSTGVDNANDDANVDGVKKVLRNGQVVILRGEAEYNVMGERL